MSTTNKPLVKNIKPLTYISLALKVIFIILLFVPGFVEHRIYDTEELTSYDGWHSDYYSELDDYSYSFMEWESGNIVNKSSPLYYKYIIDYDDSYNSIYPASGSGVYGGFWLIILLIPLLTIDLFLTVRKLVAKTKGLYTFKEIIPMLISMLLLTFSGIVYENYISGDHLCICTISENATMTISDEVFSEGFVITSLSEIINVGAVFYIVLSVGVAAFIIDCISLFIVKRNRKSTQNRNTLENYVPDIPQEYAAPQQYSIPTPNYDTQSMAQPIAPVQNNSPQYIIFKCTNCGAQGRIPANKGRVIVTCPKCNNRYEINT